jgi:hypothetical protein
MSFNLFSYPNTQTLGRTPCGLQSDGHQAPCLTGCSNLRWNDGPNERAIDRQEIRRSFGNYFVRNNANVGSQLTNSLNSTASLTPFRRAMNAGDPLNTVNMLPSSELSGDALLGVGGNSNVSNYQPSNQVQGSRRAANQSAASTASNGRRTVSGGSAYTGNPKKVYDSSDYVRYKKLLAKNNNYNDPTFGGDDHFASQVPLARVRH